MSLVTTPVQLGTELKRLRKNKKMSQSALGKKIGLSQERISAIENHPEKITVDQFFTVLMALEAELQLRPKHKSLLTPSSSASDPTKGSW